MPALSSWPGQAPTQEASRFAVGERRGRRPDFRDDLLRGIHAQAGHGRQPFDGVLMNTEQLRQFLIELLNVPLDHCQFIERQCQQPSVDRMQIGARAERVA